jgi:hypothetical protein
VQLKIGIPAGLPSNYFLQVYRSQVFSATGTSWLGANNIVANDELNFVAEVNLGSQTGYLIFDDSFSENLVQFGAFLYTNAITGTGILSANVQPPLATDINFYKGYTFFSNTQTRHTLPSFQLTGTANINPGDRITIGNTIESKSYIFTLAKPEITRIVPSSSVSAGDYFILYSANDNTNATSTDPLQNETAICFYYNIGNSGTPPTSGADRYVEIVLPSSPTLAQVTQSTIDVINQNIFDFNATNTVNISSITPGGTTTTIYTQVPHNLTTGDVVTIAGVSQTGGTTINGSKTVTVVGLFSFTIATASLPTGVTLTNATLTTAFIAVTNINAGIVTNFVSHVPSFTFTVFQTGDGEDPANFKVFLYQVQTITDAPPPPPSLLYSLGTASQDITAVARSLIRVINFNTLSPINAYYASSSTTVPGLITVQNKELGDVPFYLEASTVSTGEAFSPVLTPDYVVSGAGVITGSGSVFTFTTPTPHGLVNGNQVMISGSNVVVTPTGNIDGIYSVIVTDSTQFQVTSLTKTFVSNGSYFAWSILGDVVISTNNKTPNRLYYSTLNQPESVPILNYLDVGSGDKQILRIFPLRDSLFLFKEDGVFRLSGDSAPFVVQLFDNSTFLIAPDSVSVANNIIYGWTRRGISCINETGISEISRPIDTQILKLASNSYPNFSTVTWGVGYNSDNSYTVYTNSKTNDTYATIGYRYCNLTNSWTNFVRSQTCGIVANLDDTLYMGNATNAYIDHERKNFDRTDYADNNFNITLPTASSNSNGTVLTFPSLVGINIGDAITQTQNLTIFDYNSLLSKLDLDPLVSTVSISSVSETGLVLTFTTAAPHNLSNGQYALINAFNASGSPVISNGIYQVSSVTSTTFKITILSILPSTIVSGTVKFSYSTNLRAFTGDNLRTDILNLATRLDIDLSADGLQYYNHIVDQSGTITGNSIASPTVVTASAPLTLSNGRVVTISGSNGSLPSITGTYSISGAPPLPESTWATNTKFTVPVNVSTAGTTGLTFDTSPNSQGFTDIVACYNILITLLNNDTGTLFRDYQLVSTTTLFEAVITAVNNTATNITLNIPEQWVAGPLTVYKAIPSLIQYSPTSFNDTLSLKKLYEATAMFDNNAFTKATLSFSSDLYPAYTSIDFYRDGNGIFGMYSPTGFGYGFFGGSSNSAPFRTIIPANNQYCRYLNVLFSHQVAREFITLLGISISGNIAISTRAFR